MVNLCENCDWPESETKKREWFRWRCLKFPKPMTHQFVVSEPFLTEHPFKLCKDVNTTGECSSFEPRKGD